MKHTPFNFIASLKHYNRAHIISFKNFLLSPSVYRVTLIRSVAVKIISIDDHYGLESGTSWVVRISIWSLWWALWWYGFVLPKTLIVFKIFLSKDEDILFLKWNPWIFAANMCIPDPSTFYQNNDHSTVSQQDRNWHLNNGPKVIQTLEIADYNVIEQMIKNKYFNLKPRHNK